MTKGTSAQLEKSITVAAPVERVFDYLITPDNLLEIWPSLVEVRDVEPQPNGGNKFRWVYKMAGMRLEGQSEDVEVVRNEKTVTESRGGVDSTITLLFEPVEEGTRVTWRSAYRVPVPLLGRLAEGIIVKMNERETELILENLKARLEGAAS